MILDLVEKTYQKHDSISTVDVITDDEVEGSCDTDSIINSKVIIQAPVYKYLDGTYKIWKYTDYGYAWIKHTPNSSISYILFYNNTDEHNSDKKYSKIPVRHISDRYIFIYCLNPVRSPLRLELIARCEITMKLSEEVQKWYIQDQDTLKWIHTQNINHSYC